MRYRHLRCCPFPLLHRRIFSRGIRAYRNENAVAKDSRIGMESITASDTVRIINGGEAILSYFLPKVSDSTVPGYPSVHCIFLGRARCSMSKNMLML
jgi:hypothetical protein